LAAKRWGIETNDKGRFKETYTQRLQGRLATLPAYSNSKAEVTEDISSSDGNRVYNWQKEGSPGQAGAYTTFFNPMDGDQAFHDLLQDMSKDGLFDRQLAIFWLDFVTYNTNDDMFLHFEWKFTFDFAGACSKAVKVEGFNLRIFDTSVPKYQLISILNIIIFVFNIGFYIREFMKIAEEGFVQHFKRVNASIDMISLILCTIYNCLTWTIADYEIFHHFSFGNLFGDDNDMVKTYQDMLDISATLDIQSNLIAVNLLLMCIRGSVLFATLQFKLGLMFKVLEVSLFSILYFCTMFICVLMGFVFYGMFTFGSKYPGMATVPDSLYTCFAMLTGLATLTDLQRADDLMAYIYFYAFYVFFYLVMRNVFTSILLSGYDLVMLAQEQVKQQKSGEDKEDAGKEERNPLIELWEDIKACKAFLEKLVRRCMSYLGPYVEPVKQVFAVCYESCPCCGGVLQMFSYSKDRMKGLVSGSGEHKKEKHSHDKEGNKNQGQKQEFFFMLVFMTNFLCFIILQTRGADSFHVSEATLGSWLSDREIKEMRLFEDVGYWTQNTVVEQLYQQQWCVQVDPPSYDQYLNHPHDDNAHQCSAGAADMHVNLLRSWNFGFLNTSFVRLTVIPACFIVNPVERWAQGMPLIRKTPPGDCSQKDCVSIGNEYACRTKDGVTWDALASGEHGLYNFSDPGKLGAFQLNGGLVFDFGTTKAEATETYQRLVDGKWFTMNTAGMIFQWVTYNGNLDMFTYNVVAFGLDETGELHKRKEAYSMPLNLIEGGGDYRIQRIVIMVNFVLYFCGVCVNISNMARTWWQKRKEEGSTIVFLQKFLGNVWNFTDVVSLVINIVSIVNFVTYYLMPFRRDYIFSLNENQKYVVPDADVKKFGMAKSVDPERVVQDDWYIMRQFELANASYNMFLTIAALNSFFLAIKVVKYVSSFKPLQPFYTTICEGMSQNIFFMIIILLLLFGFAVFLNVVLGSVIPEVSSLTGAFRTLFYWMLGIFDMGPYLAANKIFSIFFFIVVMLIFYFIATNMFLATMLNKYAERVGKIQTELEEEAAKAIKKVRLVEYNPNEDPKVENDIEVEMDYGPNDGDMQVVVKSVKNKGKPGAKEKPDAELEESEKRGAAAQGVEEGDVMMRVNRDSKEFKEMIARALKESEGENPLRKLEADKRTGLISIYFKRKQKGVFGLEADEEETKVKAEFWKSSTGGHNILPYPSKYHLKGHC
jgi:hypothetical protein